MNTMFLLSLSAAVACLLVQRAWPSRTVDLIGVACITLAVISAVLEGITAKKQP